MSQIAAISRDNVYECYISFQWGATVQSSRADTRLHHRSVLELDENFVLSTRENCNIPLYRSECSSDSLEIRTQIMTTIAKSVGS